MEETSLQTPGYILASNLLMTSQKKGPAVTPNYPGKLNQRHESALVKVATFSQSAEIAASKEITINSTSRKGKVICNLRKSRLINPRQVSGQSLLPIGSIRGKNKILGVKHQELFAIRVGKEDLNMENGYAAHVNHQEEPQFFYESSKASEVEIVDEAAHSEFC